MNPQYLPQQPQQQYGAPTGPGFGPQSSGYPPVSQGGPRPSPSGTPGGYQFPPGPPGPGAMHPSGPPGPQRMGPLNQVSPPLNSSVSQGGGPVPPGPGMMSMSSTAGSQQPGYNGPSMTNGPAGPPTGPQVNRNVQGGPGLQQPASRGPHPMQQPPPVMGPPPNQLAAGMSEMNISGPRPPIPNSNIPSGPPIKPGLGSMPGGPLPSNNYPPGSFSPAVNGGLPPTSSPNQTPSPGQQQRGPMPPSQYMNGSMGPSPGPGRGPPQPGSMASPSGSMSPQQGVPPPSGSMHPQQGSMPPPPGSMPPQQGSMPPPPGSMPPQQGGMPPPSGSMSSSGSMPPQPGGMPHHHPASMPPHHPGGMPPQSGGMPPHHPAGMPPHPGGMPPHPGGMPPQSGGMPPHPGGMPPQSGGMPPQLGGMPPQPGGMPPQPGGMPPQPGGMPPHPGGMPPPHSGGMPHPGGIPPPTGAMPPQPGRMPSYDPHKQYSQSPDMYHPGASPQMQQPPMGPPGPGPNYPSPHQPMGPAQPTHPGLQSQPARRLDPDQMPSPIQVMQDDQRNRSGIFYTNQKGQVPPLVTTHFITQDQGNASPRFLRSSMYNVPATIDMMKQTAVPFGIVVSPLARTLDEEYLPPIVNIPEIGPVRCNRCKAYMCPFMQFIDGGRRFHCLFCKATTEVPPEYFQHLDHTGQRVDRFERPELMLGAYEFVATKDYCRNNTFPKPPAVIFLIDVSYNNIKSGMVHLLCSRMKEIVKLLPKDEGAEKSNMRVGFITYNNTVHFYNIKGCLAQPQMMVVGDVQDMFMPLLEGFLCDPLESEAVIDSLMEQIPTMFADTRETETVLAPAIQAGLEALKASECSGKLLVFHSSLPIAEAPGKLKNRDDRKLLGTEKERTVLAPQVNVYNNLGQECVGVGCSVDLFVFNNSYIDLATIGQVARLTGGEIYKYTYFQADLDGERLIADIKRDVSRPVAFDAIMRVRTSTGVRATDFYGHFFMSNTTDMELASIDCDKAVAIEIKHDDKLTEEDGVYIQVALLYTSCGGQRRLRILNLSLKTCSQMADLYRSCDLDTIVNFFSKQAVFRLLDSSPKPVKENLVNRCAQMLACYRKNCASPSSAGQLILPECMKLLPLYVNCILKSDAISGGSDMTVDDRSFVMQAVTVMDIPSSVVFFYPRLIPLHEIDVNSNELPSPIRCTSDKIRDDGVYLLENGIHLFLWIGLNVGMEWVQNVFGVHSAAQIDIDRTALPDLDNPLSQRIRSVIDSVREQRHRCMRLTLVRQRDKLEMVFKHFLMEDRGLDGSASYVDFLCHMHKEIRNLLS
ncbi:protein transport protein Sec24C isoform X2 [Periplaneta americana]|uniref:protein transport protein Sec24C isoform X2 n=1 Tax=Periplaneta americana TaxID=6978 RepID=UPI0037E968A2